MLNKKNGSTEGEEGREKGGGGGGGSRIAVEMAEKKLYLFGATAVIARALLIIEMGRRRGGDWATGHLCLPS